MVCRCRPISCASLSELANQCNLCLGHLSLAGKRIMASSTLACLFCLLAINALAEAASVVKEIPTLKEVNAIPGLTHATIAGALRDGHREVEAWVQTLAPGASTPIHRHDCEEIFIILTGGGTVKIAPQAARKSPGEPVATPFSANSTFSIPQNAVHQVLNTGDEDCQLYVVMSRPPLKPFLYKTWDTPHTDALAMFPLPWDAPESDATSFEKQEL